MLFYCIFILFAVFMFKKGAYGKHKFNRKQYQGF